jgi:hypothetical protein
MLILRAIYSDELRSGMTRAEVAKRLPSIFARINPVGNSVPATRLGKTHRQWKSYISKALGGATTNSERFQAAQSAVNFANQAGWRDHRLGFSYYVLARLMRFSARTAILAYIAPMLLRNWPPMQSRMAAAKTRLSCSPLTSIMHINLKTPVCLLH